MGILTSKWLLAALLLITVLVLLYLFGRKSVHTEIDIPAPVDQVWSVLMNIDVYPHWNTVMEPLTGELKEGETLVYRFHQAEGQAYEVSSNVKQIVKNSLLNQAGGVPAILTYNHRYELVAIENGTRVIIHEDYRGIAVPFWNPAPVLAAYQRLNQALKKRVLKVYPHE